MTRNTYEPISFIEFQQRFATEEACKEQLFKARWPDGFICPRCGGNRCSKITTRRLYQCSQCHYQASVTAGTTMHRAKLPLRYWFWAIYLCVSDKRGCSALALQNKLDVSYEAAWLLLHKIRSAMAERDFFYQLCGIVEVDEAYFGGEATNEAGSRKHSGRGTTKVPVAVSLSLSDKGRPLYVKMEVLESLTATDLTGFVQDAVEPGAKVMTDRFLSYAELANLGYEHEWKSYSTAPPEYLKWIHTVIGNAKAFIQGTYHGLDRKHLQAYLDEFCYRFNRRLRAPELFSRLLFACVETLPPTFAELTA